MTALHRYIKSLHLSKGDVLVVDPDYVQISDLAEMDAPELSGVLIIPARNLAISSLSKADAVFALKLIGEIADE